MAGFQQEMAQQQAHKKEVLNAALKAGELTFAFVKPDAYEKRVEILKRVKKEGFEIVAQRTVRFTKEQAEKFYEEHRGR